MENSLTLFSYINLLDSLTDDFNSDGILKGHCEICLHPVQIQLFANFDADMSDEEYQINQKRILASIHEDYKNKEDCCKRYT